MKKEDYTKLFDDLLSKVPKPYHVDARVLPTGSKIRGGEYLKADEASSWLAQASEAIESVLSEGQASRKMWDSLLERVAKSGTPTPHIMDRFRGVFEGVAELLRGDRLSSLVDSIRAETEGDFLDQAVDLCKEGRLALASILTGAALEVHLRRLCEKNGIVIKGNGSIGAYQQALDSSRNSGKEVISGSSSKMVVAWGGLRNEAAHRPDQFKSSLEEVRLMIDGVRSFIDKYQ